MPPIIEVDRLSKRYGSGTVALDEVSPALRTALVLSEDRRFWEHAGVDWPSIGRAVVENADQSPAQLEKLLVTSTADAARQVAGLDPSPVQQAAAVVARLRDRPTM